MLYSTAVDVVDIGYLGSRVFRPESQQRRGASYTRNHEMFRGG